MKKMNGLVRYLALMMALVMMAGTVPVVAFADDDPLMITAWNYTGDGVAVSKFQLRKQNETDDPQFTYDKNQRALILSGGTLVVSTTSQTTERIIVDGNATLILDGVNIAAVDGPAIEIQPGKTATITLQKENTILGGSGYAGLEVSWESGYNYAHLTINGDGILNSTGGSGGGGAGIGGSKARKGIYGDITINSGTIIATGSGRGAGIGSSDNPADGTSRGSYKSNGDEAHWGTITINGGNITAKGVKNGAGIGGGNHTDSGIIIINDGIINAQGDSGIGAGLGSSGGSDKGPGYYCAYVTINGGNITAYATNNMGAGIGGGMYSDAYVTITGGTIHASVSLSGKAYQSGAGIGGGYQGEAVVVITGGDVTAYGGHGGPGIGNGALGARTVENGTKIKNVRTGKPAILAGQSSVTISGSANVKAYGGTHGAGIGSGNACDESHVTITGGSVLAVGGKSSESAKEGAAGIGSGSYFSSNKKDYKQYTDVTVNITGGSVTAIGGWGAAGIGSGANNKIANNVTVSGGNVQAYSDGTKFAVDTRKLNADGSTAEYISRSTGNANVIQSTFMFPWEATSGRQDARGLNPITIVNETTGEIKTLTKMPEGYRSFATTVNGNGSYTVYSTDDDIASGNGAYFSASRNEETTPDNNNGETVLLPLTTGTLSDNFFLYPVKTIKVEKSIEHDDTIDADGINMTAYFMLKKKGVNEYLEGKKQIEIINGVPQGAAYFVNVPEGNYSIQEVDEDGNRLALNSVFGTAELKSIETRDHTTGTDNTGIISDVKWSDDVTVINTFSRYIPTIDIEGTKTWLDHQNQDGKRPTSITVTLLADGEEYASAEVTGQGDEWSYQFKQVPESRNDGSKIVYTVKEADVDGYVVSYDDFAITNTHEIEKTSVTGSKTWSDNNDQDGKRPQSITIYLLADGEQQDSRTVTADDDWAWKFDDLDVYANGQKISYTIAEEPVADYASVVTDFDVKNVHEIEKTTVEGIKTWSDNDNQDGKRPESITIYLLADGEQQDSRTVTADDDWAWKFDDLDVYANGQKISYTIAEEPVADYTSVVTGFDVENIHTPETITLQVEKKWVDQKNIRPDSLTVTLSKNGESLKDYTLTAADEWKLTTEALPKYESGKEIAYSWAENVPSEYESEMTIENGITIFTNSQITGNLTITKTFEGVEGVNPDILDGLSIQVTGPHGYSRTVLYSEFVDGSVLLSDLPLGEYLIRETNAENLIQGYTFISENEEQTALLTEEQKEYVVSLVNQYAAPTPVPTEIPTAVPTAEPTAAPTDVPTTEPTAEPTPVPTENPTKVPTAEPTATPTDAPTMEPTAEPTPVPTENPTAVPTAEPTAAPTDVPTAEPTAEPTSVPTEAPTVEPTAVPTDEPTAAPTNVPTAEPTAEPSPAPTENPTETPTAEPTAVPTDVPTAEHTAEPTAAPTEAPTEVPANNPPVNPPTPTEEPTAEPTEEPVEEPTPTPAPVLTAVQGTKTWIDNENQDGLRPNRIVINLYANGTLVARAHVSSASGWTWNFEGLRKYDDLGDEIIYTIDEEPVEGYVTILNGYDAVNIYTPESTTQDVVKIWDDMNDLDGSRPESVTVTLLANGQPVQTVILNEDNLWSASVSDLPLNENGTPIEYTWIEEPVEGYTLSASEEMGNVTVLTNTHVPELTQVTVRILWEDEDNAQGLRPQAVHATLSNGVIVILNADNNWTTTVTDLPTTFRGQEIEYTWTEQEISGYVLTDVTVEGDITTFTNALWHRPDPPVNAVVPPRRPGVSMLIIEDYDTPLGIDVDINHVGYCFD